MNKIKIFFLSAVVVLSGLSCGYTTRANLASHLKTIYIDDFKNSIDYSASSQRNIYFPLLEVNAKTAIVDRFMFDGNLRIAEKDDADLILTGELKNYRRDGLRFTDNDDVQEYRVTITVSIQMYDVQKDEVMFSEPNFTGDATYFVTGVNATTEESALNEALVDLAKNIVERTVDNW